MLALKPLAPCALHLLDVKQHVHIHAANLSAKLTIL